VTIYFMGGELSSFIPSSSSVTESTATSGGTFDSSFSRCYMSGGASALTYYASPAIAVPDEFYCHAYLRRKPNLGSSTYTLLSFWASSVEVFRIESTATTLQMKALIGAVMTTVGSPLAWDTGVLEHVDLYVDGNTASGTATLYFGGTERITAAADLSSVTGIDEVRGEYSAIASQVIIADEPTIGWRLLTRYPNGAGAATAWTGGYTDVDEAVCDDGDFCNSSTNGQVEQFTQTGPAITGYTVRAVGVYARAKKGGSGPTNLQIGIRVSSTDYFSASKALSVGYSAYGEIWEQNPATTADWLNTAIDAIQPSIKAVT
jgi:hypothetical protein